MTGGSAEKLMIVGSIIVVFSVMILFAHILDCKSEAVKFGRFGANTVIALLFGLFLIYGYFKCNNQPYQDDIITSTEYIVALQDNNMTNGRHVYARRGYIESDLYYQYMLKFGAGYKANKIKAKNTIVYIAEDNFRVEWHTKEKNWLFFTMWEEYKKIYIPEGSIVEDYTIDLE